MLICTHIYIHASIHIHSFSHFYSAPSSTLPLRGAPDYSTDTVSEFHAKAHRQMQVKDLPKVLTRRLERTHNPPVESHRLNQGTTTSHITLMTHNYIQVHAYIHTYKQTSIHTHIHNYKRTHVPTKVNT